MEKHLILVAIADYHPIVRLGIRTLLETDGSMEVVKEYSDSLNLMEDYQSADWDILVLDIDLTDGNGLEMTKEMLLERPELKVLILSIYPESKYAVRAMKAGAKGYLNKSNMLEDLCSAITKVAAGKLYVSDELSQILAEEATTVSAPSYGNEPHSQLSDRELQVLCLLGAGKTNHEIAEKLFISIKTVSTYKARILEKMNLKTTSELIACAINHDLVV